MKDGFWGERGNGSDMVVSCNAGVYDKAKN